MENVLKQFLAKYNCYCEVKPCSYWAYDSINEVILFVPNETESAEAVAFYNFCISQGLKTDCGLFIMSFFHELGHYVTQNEDFPILKSKKTLYGYFSAPIEISATKWAIHFIDTHADEIMKLKKKLEKCLTKA